MSNKFDILIGKTIRGITHHEWDEDTLLIVCTDGTILPLRAQTHGDSACLAFDVQLHEFSTTELVVSGAVETIEDAMFLKLNHASEVSSRQEAVERRRYEELHAKYGSPPQPPKEPTEGELWAQRDKTDQAFPLGAAYLEQANYLREKWKREHT